MIVVPSKFKFRYLLAFLLSFGLGLGSFFRGNINIAIVCMVSDSGHGNVSLIRRINDSAFNESSHHILREGNWSLNSPDDDCLLEDVNYGSNNAKIGEFTWNKELQGFILGAMFWGYLCLQIPCGWLVQRFGARKTVTSGMLIVSLCSLLSPLAARVSPYLLIVMRVLTGMFVSVLFPSNPLLWVHWAPQAELSTLQGIVFTGAELGNALIFPLSSVLCEYGFDGGWPSIFYVTGAMGVVWTTLWWLLVRDRPAEVPWISEHELSFIERDTIKRVGQEKHVRVSPCRMMSTRAAWTLVVTHMLYNYAYFMLQIELPTYFKEVMRFNINANGIVSMLPFLGTGLFIFITGYISDALVRKSVLSPRWTRKLLNTIGMVIPAAMMVIIAQLDCRNQIAAVAVLCIAGSFAGLPFSGGFMVNFVEIALLHSSTLFALSNTVAALPGIVAPYVVAKLTPNGTPDEWQTCFYVTAAILLISALVFLLLSKSDPEVWAMTSRPDIQVHTERTELQLQKEIADSEEQKFIALESDSP